MRLSRPCFGVAIACCGYLLTGCGGGTESASEPAASAPSAAPATGPASARRRRCGLAVIQPNARGRPVFTARRDRPGERRATRCRVHLHVARGVGPAGGPDRRRRHDVLHDRKELLFDRRGHVRGEVARRVPELAPVPTRRAARFRVSRRAALQRYVRRSRARARRGRRPYALGCRDGRSGDTGRLDADGADRRERPGLHRQRGRRPNRRHRSRLCARRARRPRRLAVRGCARRARGAGDLAERGPLSDYGRCVLDLVRARRATRRPLRAGRQPRARLRRASARRRQLVHELADRARRGDRENHRL